MPSARRLAWCLALPAVLLAGCAGHADRLREIRDDFYFGNIEEASRKIDRHAKEHGKEADVFKLDRAVVELTAGRPREAEKILREVRDSFDYLQQKSLTEGAATILADDTYAAYPGEDYERVLLRVYLALANLMNGGDDATAYSLQAADLQEQIIQTGTEKDGKNPKLAYKRVALAAYIQGALREETHIDYDDAARSFARVVSWEPQFPYGRFDYDRTARGRHSARGNGVLYAFVLVGRGPYKEQTEEMAATVATLVGDRIVSATGKHTLPPNIASIKVPKVIAAPGLTQTVEVAVDRRPVGVTATVTDVGKLAVEQYAAIYPQVLTKAVARRVAKKGIVYGGKELGGVENGSWVNLAIDLAGIVWEASEQADTRCWGLLPDRIQVLRIEMPAGDHTIGLRPLGAYGGAYGGGGGVNETTVRIIDGRNTYLLATMADGRLIGKIQNSRN
jgi:uncharacterized protein